MGNFKLINTKNNSHFNNSYKKTTKKSLTDIVSFNPNGASYSNRRLIQRKPQFSSLPFIFVNSHEPKKPSYFPPKPSLRVFRASTSADRTFIDRSFSSGQFTPEPDPDTDIGTLSSKYGLDRRRQEEDDRNSPPKSPPPFSKAESRFEREQRIRVGSLDSYTPGGTLERQRR